MTNPKNGLPDPDSKGALYRLIVVLVTAICILIYSYGWTVTEIDLAVPQEEQRQDNLTRALRELLSPNIFTQERELEIYEASFLMNCETGDAPEQTSASNATYVVLEPACADSGEVITVKLFNAIVSADARIRWHPPVEEGEEVNPRPREILELGREDFVIGSNGNFEGSIEVPLIRGGDGEIHTVRVLTAVPSGPIRWSDTATQVIERMMQSVFMALVATTVAIPIAALISFFAARNLMRRVTLTTGTMLLTFISLTLGMWLGSTYLGGLGRLGMNIGKGDIIEGIVGVIIAIIIPVVVVGGAGFLLTQIAKASADNNKDKRGLRENSAVAVANTVITTITLMFAIGAFGGLLMLIGGGVSSVGNAIQSDTATGFSGWLQNAPGIGIWSLGNLLTIVGTLVELFINPLVGVAFGFGLSGILSTLFAGTIREIEGIVGNILGAIMGAISGAILMSIMASFGLWSALLGILPLVIGAILGGNVLNIIVKRILARPQTIGHPTHIQNFSRQVVFWIGFGVLFLFLFRYLSFGRSIVDGTLPPQTQVELFGINIGMTSYMFRAALVGAILCGIGGGISSVQATFPLGDLLYNTSRTTLNIVRSIEPLIMGLVFVVWVGIGPFAGVLALTLHSIAALGKLYSEQIENIDPGPIEALESTGANQLQTIIYSVVPQIVPPYIAFTMYRWDINVRMSTIVGFVGGGGIGLLLQQQINLLRYRDAGVAVLAIAIVVSVLDYASAYIREKLT